MPERPREINTANHNHEEHTMPTRTQRPPLYNPSEQDARRLQTIWNEAAAERCGAKAEVTEIPQRQFSAGTYGYCRRYTTVPLEADGRIARGTSEAVCRVRVVAGGPALSRRRAQSDSGSATAPEANGRSRTRGRRPEHGTSAAYRVPLRFRQPRRLTHTAHPLKVKACRAVARTLTGGAVPVLHGRQITGSSTR